MRALGAEKALGELEVAHLEREEQHGAVRPQRCVGSGAQRERRLAHGRAGADDDERVRLQTGGELVEVGVARRGAGDGLAALVELLEAVEAGVEQVAELDHRVADPPLGDLVHHRLGVVERLRDVVERRVAQLGDVARRRDEPPEQRVLLDDLGVVRRRC